MTHVDHASLLQTLHERRDPLVERWFRAIAYIGFSEVNTVVLRQQLGALADSLIALLTQEAIDLYRARGIGVALAKLHYTPSTEVLSRSQDVLMREFGIELPIEQFIQVQPRLATLLGALAAGFCDQARDTVLAEQEQIRHALLVERNQAMAALRASEVRLRMITTNLPVILFALDQSGIFTLSEGQGLESLGLRASDLVGKSVFALYKDALDTSQWTGRALSGDLRKVPGPHGDVIFELWTMPLHDARGTLIGVSGMAIDVTKRERTADQVTHTQALLTTIIDNLPYIVLLKDAHDLRFVLVNRAGEQFSGLPASELLGRSDHDVFPPAQADYFVTQDRKTLENRMPMTIPAESVETSHRGTRVLRTRKIPIFGSDVQPRYLLSLSEDITERVHEGA